jgi:flagellar motility protein MotE (MotC chaperone)
MKLERLILATFLSATTSCWGTLHAAEPPAEEAAPAAPSTPQTPEVDSSSTSEASGSSPSGTEDKPAMRDLVTGCPPIDEAELQLLRALRERRRVLEEREHMLERREAALAQIEQQLLGRVEQTLDEVRRLEREAGVKPVEGDRKDRVAGLVASLAALSPRKAAPVLENTDTDLAVILLIRLGPERAGDLLGRMDATRAATLVEALAAHSRRRSAHPGKPRRRKP